MKKLLLTTLVLLSIGSANVCAGERMAKDPEPETSQQLIIPSYFVQVYEDTENPSEIYIPMLNDGVLVPVCIERIYQWYYYDAQYDRHYFDPSKDPIYNINGKDYISLRK